MGLSHSLAGSVEHAGTNLIAPSGRNPVSWAAGCVPEADGHALGTTTVMLLASPLPLPVAPRSRYAKPAIYRMRNQHALAAFLFSTPLLLPLPPLPPLPLPPPPLPLPPLHSSPRLLFPPLPSSSSPSSLPQRGQRLPCLLPHHPRFPFSCFWKFSPAKHCIRYPVPFSSLVRPLVRCTTRSHHPLCLDHVALLAARDSSPLRPP